MANPMFTKLKRFLTPEQVAERYVGKLNRGGFISCPFHVEQTQSMKVGGRNTPEKFKCMGACKWHGDIVDFTAKLFELTQYEAVQKLVSDFNAPVSLAPPSKEDLARQRERERKRAEYKRFKAILQRKTNPKFFEALSSVRKLAPLFWSDPENPYKKFIESDEVIGYFICEEFKIKEPITADSVRNFKYNSFMEAAEQPEWEEFSNALFYMKANPLPDEEFYKKEYLKQLTKQKAK